MGSTLYTPRWPGYRVQYAPPGLLAVFAATSAAQLSMIWYLVMLDVVLTQYTLTDRDRQLAVASGSF